MSNIIKKIGLKKLNEKEAKILNKSVYKFYKLENISNFSPVLQLFSIGGRWGVGIGISRWHMGHEH